MKKLIALFVLLVGAAATGLSAALSYGPQHAWDWIHPPVLAGLSVAPVLAIGMAWVPRRVCAALALLALGIYLSLLNQAPADPYFSQTLQTWEPLPYRGHGRAKMDGRQMRENALWLLLGIATYSHPQQLSFPE